MNKLPREFLSPVVVVCHDAGAANHIFAWLKNWFNHELLINYQIRLIIEGPARKIWLDNPIDSKIFKLYDELALAFEDAKTILSGTGWASTLEYDAIKLARNIEIDSIAVVDHWVNYKERFVRNEIEFLPNYIWVTDSDAFKIAKINFNNIIIKKMPNYYLSNLVENITPFSEKSINLLYVLEPIRNDWNRNLPGEFQALDYFVENINKITGNSQVSIKLRLHPSDNIDKYDKWIEANKEVNPMIDPSNSLLQSISNAKWVVGAETYALVVAISANRLTWSSLPPWAPKSNLPDIGIKYLRLN
jgi:hypothetical protein